MFKAGYKFKETHPQVHFIKEFHSDPSDDYGSNFTRDGSEAKKYATEELAQEEILKFMENFKRDDDCRWTPVVVNLDNNSQIVTLDSRWH